MCSACALERLLSFGAGLLSAAQGERCVGSPGHAGGCSPPSHRSRGAFELGLTVTPGSSAPHRLKKSQEQTSESVSPPETTDEAETEAESETSNLNMCSSVCSSAGSS